MRNLVLAQGRRMNWLTLQLPSHTPRSSGRAGRCCKHYTPGQSPGQINSLFKFPQARQSFRQPAQIHSLFNCLSRTPPRSIHPLFNFPSQIGQVPKATHPLFNFCIIRWSQRAGRGRVRRARHQLKSWYNRFPSQHLHFPNQLR